LIGGQINVTEEVENYPGFPEALSGYELTERMHRQAEHFGTEFKDEEVTALGMEGHCKIVETSDNKYRARAVYICTGAYPRRLNVPGEEKFTGRGVSYCATCDGALYRDKIVAVIGGVILLLKKVFSSLISPKKFVVIHRRDELRAQKIIQERAFKNPRWSLSGIALFKRFEERIKCKN
jgi:thioredoxin reductase (NADPH)